MKFARVRSFSALLHRCTSIHASFLPSLSCLLASSRMSTRVYVGGISHRARERDVEKLFDRFGRIKDVSLKNGFAFVEFDDDRDADDAVYDLNRTTFMGER